MKKPYMTVFSHGKFVPAATYGKKLTLFAVRNSQAVRKVWLLK